jgi:2-phosphosulfolactate phosphatase
MTVYRCDHAWGRHGAREAARRGDIIVIVDVLSFSTAAVTALQHGAIIYPCSIDEDAEALAGRIDGELAVARKDVPARGRFSLSSMTFTNVEPGTKVVLPSPNGATCVIYGREVPSLLVGALVNAQAVAAAVTQILDETGTSATVVSAGERWPEPAGDEGMRAAIEDLLGAGAILAALGSEKSPEALVCQHAFEGSRHDLHRLVWESASGRELRQMGYPGEVRHATQLDLYDVVPVMRGDALIAFRDGSHKSQVTSRK